LENGLIKEYAIEPSDFGLAGHPLTDVKGGGPTENVEKLRQILSDNDRSPTFDFVLMNTSALLFIAGVASNFKEGVELARKSVSSGRALEALNTFSRLALEF
jgi:anthranilate phosphoribosyltransferase